MSIQILPQQGSAASNLGAGLGQALSQQIPEEIMRYRTRQGLESLGNQPNLTPAQLYAGLATVPGLDPGLIGVLAPVLQQQIERREQQGGGTPPQPQGIAQGWTGAAPAPTPGAMAQREEARAPAHPVIPVRREERQGYLIPPTDSQIQQIAQELSKNQSFTYRTPQAANTQARAREIANNDYTQDVAYQERKDRGIQTFDKLYGEYLQKEKPFQEGEIGGKLRSELENKFLDELAFTDKSERQLAQKYAQRGLNIARDFQQMKKISNDWGALKPPGDKTVEDLRNMKKRFEREGMSEDVFIDSLVSTQRISREGASYIAQSGKDTSAGQFARSLTGGSIGNLFKNRLSPSEVAKQIAEKITDKDNLQSLAFILSHKGYQPAQILQEVRALGNLSDEQQRQVRDVPSYYRPNINDVWLLGRSGGLRGPSGERGELLK